MLPPYRICRYSAGRAGSAPEAPAVALALVLMVHSRAKPVPVTHLGTLLFEYSKKPPAVAATGSVARSRHQATRSPPWKLFEPSPKMASVLFALAGKPRNGMPPF